METKIHAEQHNVGADTLVWFAHVNGEVLRDKRGVGRRFKTEAAALKAAEKGKSNG